eukprot:128894_1
MIQNASLFGRVLCSDLLKQRSARTYQTTRFNICGSSKNKQNYCKRKTKCIFHQVFILVMSSTFNQCPLEKFEFTLETLKDYVQEHEIHFDSLAIAAGPQPKTEDSTNSKPLCRIISNYIGNQLAMYLPIHPLEGYESEQKKQKLINMIIDAIKYGAELNIKYVCLLGTTPSITNYGKDIIERLKLIPFLNHIILTTAHATTLSCMATNCEYVLNKTKRIMKNEIIGVLGCGSIGYGSMLTIMATLNKNNYPRKILLCDVQKQLARMNRLKHELRNEFKYKGIITVVISEKHGTNDLFYESSVILGATSRPNILNPYKLRRGCIIIDDSAPHCFDEIKAWKRFKEKKDILFIEGGLVNIPGKQVEFFAKLKSDRVKVFYDIFGGLDDKIFSCRLGGMLLAKFADKVKPILGPVKYMDGVLRLKLFKEIGIEGCMHHVARSNILRDGHLTYDAIDEFIACTNVLSSKL